MTSQSFDGKNDTITPEQVQYWDQKHLIHPWSEFSEDSFDMTQVSKADGIYLYDAYGNKLIDGPGGIHKISAPVFPCCKFTISSKFNAAAEFSA